VGRPAGWGAAQEEDYTTNRYHQPGDHYRADWDLKGAVQLTTIVLELTRELGNSRVWPTWAPTAEFRRAPKM
jgi:hypothetical protein